MQHTQAFAEDSAHRLAVDRQDLARAHDSHSLYDPALSGLWSYHQSSFTAPVNPSHYYPDGMNSHSFDQSSFSHHVSEPSSYNGDHQPLDANFALESPPTASNDFDFSAPPIDRASGPQRDLHNRRTAQIEATSAPYPVHRQLHESLSAGYPSTFPNSYTNLSNDIISPQPHDLYHAPGFVLGNDAGAHELTDTQAHISTQQPSANTRSRVRSSGSSQHGSRTGKRVRTPSPALTADSTLSAGSGIRRASPDDGKPGPLRVPTPLPPNKKGRLYNVDRRDICLYAQQNPDARQEDIARKWHVERSTISKILKNKDKWLKIKEDETILVAKDRSLKFGDIEDNMLRWVEECFLQTRPISDAMIYEEATRLRDLAHIDPDKFKVSPGWIENFKQRIGIRGGIWYGHGTKGKKLVAVGGEVEPVRWVGRTPDEPIFSPSAADAIQREGLYDVNTAIDIWFPGMSSFKYSSEDILRMVGASTYSEAYDRCQQWYQDHPGELAPWSEAQDFFKVVLDEEKAETAAVLTAELEARRRAVEARDAGEEFNFHDTFLRLVKDALRSVPEVDKRGHAFPIRPLDSHPDDVPHTQGPSAEDAHLAMMKVLSYVTMRDNIVTREQEQVLLSVWQSFCIMKDRDSRRLKRIKLVPEIANSDPFGEVISFMPPWAFLKPHIPDGPDSETGSPL